MLHDALEKQRSVWRWWYSHSPDFIVSNTRTQVTLVNISVADLGFKGGASYPDIYKRAQELGLQLAPAEVGPQLRLQYLEPSYAEVDMYIGISPIFMKYKDGRVDEVPRVFDVKNLFNNAFFGDDEADSVKVCMVTPDGFLFGPTKFLEF